MNEYQIEYSLFFVDHEDEEYILPTWTNLSAHNIDSAEGQINNIFHKCSDNLVTDEIETEYNNIVGIQDSGLNILTINRITGTIPEDKEVIHRDFTKEGEYDETDKCVQYHDIIWDAKQASLDEDYEAKEVAIYWDFE